VDTQWRGVASNSLLTIARQFVAEHKARTGEALCFTGFLVFCLARAVDENKEVHAYLKGHNQTKQFVTAENCDMSDNIRSV
jgi:pyruvate/2-oxoglutarate dehydrogenase complex dihydrolipoamide acyltransferase (E2) component